MLKHRIIFIGVWVVLVVALFVFPGFEVRGLAMGLVIGYWPFMIIGESSINPLIIFLVMFVLSGTTVGLFAWLMDNARMTKNIWLLLAFSIIVGRFLTIDLSIGKNLEWGEWEIDYQMI